MKRIFLLLAMVATTAFTSCTNEDDRVDSDTIAEVFEINQNTSFTAANNYTVNYTLNPQIFNSDMILIYRLSGTSGGNDVWEALPQTYYFGGGVEYLQYTFDFTVNNINIYLDSNFDPAEEPAFSLNQVFRVVVIPGYLSNKGGTSVDLSNYNAVMQAYNLTDSNVRTIGERK
jgi:hypothetical protein